MNNDLTKRLDEDTLFNRLCNSDKVAMTSIVVDAFNIGSQSRQDEVGELQGEVDVWKDELIVMSLRYERLQRKLKGVSESADWHIEDCACSHPMSKYQLGWFEAMTLVKKKLEGETK